MSNPLIVDPLAQFAALCASVPEAVKKAVAASAEKLPFAPIFLLSLIATTGNGGGLAVAFQPAYTSRKNGEDVAESEVLVYWPTIKYAKACCETGVVPGRVTIKKDKPVTKWNHAYFRDAAGAYNSLEMIKDAYSLEMIK